MVSSISPLRAFEALPTAFDSLVRVDVPWTLRERYTRKKIQVL